MAVIEETIKDIMRGRSQGKVKIRYDPEDVAELPCHCTYDPALCAEEGNRVRLLRKIEVQMPDGSWAPYPSYTWLDGVDHEDQLTTAVAIMLTGEAEMSIMFSAEGVPDGKLGVAASEAGIHSE